MFFEGQRYYIDTPIANTGMTNDKKTKAAIRDTFRDLYKTRYGHLIDAPLKTINVRLKAIGKLKDIPARKIDNGEALMAEARKANRQVYMEGRFVNTPIYERGFLRCGNTIQGPAIIEEPFHITAILPRSRSEG